VDSTLTIAACPYCGLGRCAVRVCNEKEFDQSKHHALANHCHAFVMCDACHAIWEDPDLTNCHQYLSASNPICPICEAELSSPHSEDGLTGSWATPDQVAELNWDYMLRQGTMATSDFDYQEIESLLQSGSLRALDGDQF